MLDVYLTCDTEIWCPSWRDVDATFPAAFERYVRGGQRGGHDHALPYQLRMLSDHGLHGVFFVEPLFAARFGLPYLREIVSLIQDAGHEVQLHLHTEWADEARERLLPHVREKRQFLRLFDTDEQAVLIAEGARLLQAAGAPAPTAFRAGSFGFDHRTLQALRRCGITRDSSYNALLMGATSGVSPGRPLHDLVEIDGLAEYPVTVYRDGFGRWRNVQLGACSFAEMREVLDGAADAGYAALVLVFHNFELLDTAKAAPDPVMIRRFESLCRHLADHRERFRTRGFRGDPPRPRAGEPAPLRTGVLATSVRWAEQVYRRVAVR